MEPDVKYCIQELADAIEENDDGSVKFSGSENIRKKERLSPIIIEGLEIDPNRLRISPERLENKIDQLILDAKRSGSGVIEYIEANLGDFEQEIRNIEVQRYRLAFPLNYHRNSRDLISDEIQITDIRFQRISKSDWQSQFAPNFEEENLGRIAGKLSRFLDRSPNKLDNAFFTYWFADCYARDEKFAVERIIDRLRILLGLMNMAMSFGRIQTTSISSGPWPNRWADLREPFVYLLYGEDHNLLQYYYSEDASLRKKDKPHSMFEDSFADLMQMFPSFENQQQIDSRLFNGIRSFQAGISNGDTTESFFDFWRGVENLALVREDEKMATVTNRATAMNQWRNPRIGEIRTRRAINKRNEYVHEGADLRVTIADRNLLKTLLESLIELYIDKREDWDEGDMRFALEKFSIDEQQLAHMRKSRERELNIIEWMDQIREENTD